MNSCVAFCSTRCRAALCGSDSAVSWLTAAAASCCQFASDSCKLLYAPTQQPWMLPPVLRAHGAVRIAVAPWFSSKNSLLNRSTGDLSGRASLTPHSRYSSPKYPLAPARAPNVCFNPFCSAKTDQRPSNTKASANFPRVIAGLPYTLAPLAVTRFALPEDFKSIQHP